MFITLKMLVKRKTLYTRIFKTITSLRTLSLMGMIKVETSGCHLRKLKSVRIGKYITYSHTAHFSFYIVLNRNLRIIVTAVFVKP